ncbi:hypothetical protein [Mucisphaera calidilacus]|uniref:Uncharacterized protein n=1 Tax=Mucisphaera calidilacus TaxID=2527982 RepID=A0A518BVW8_9BACT|nr:hypothetical protein [Mucisphaera calidilacus]QDU71107.1 hypothetical protein Pan265_09550 [Mucisphaera calidilacus]
MTNRTGWLIGICITLILAWLLFGVSWGGDSVQLVIKHTSPRPKAAADILFGLNQTCQVSMIEVHRLEKNDDGEWFQPLFGLEADPIWRSIPRGADYRDIQAFMYGQRARGMRHDVRPKPLEPDGRYQITIESRQGTIVQQFAATPQKKDEAEPSQASQ